MFAIDNAYAASVSNVFCAVSRSAAASQSPALYPEFGFRIIFLIAIAFALRANSTDDMDPDSDE